MSISPLPVFDRHPCLAFWAQPVGLRSSPDVDVWSRPSESLFLRVSVTLFREATECMGGMASSCPRLADLNMPSWRNRRRSPFLRFGQRQVWPWCARGIVCSVPSLVSSAPVSGSLLSAFTPPAVSGNCFLMRHQQLVNASSQGSAKRFAVARLSVMASAIFSYASPSMHDALVTRVDNEVLGVDVCTTINVSLLLVGDSN